MSQDEEVATPTPEEDAANKERLRQLMRTHPVLSRTLATMITMGQAFAWSYQIALRLLKEQVSDDRAKVLVELMRDAAYERIEQGYHTQRCVLELQNEIVPFLKEQYDFEETVAAAAGQPAGPEEHPPVKLPVLTLLRNEVTLLFGPKRILRGIFRDMAEALRQGVPGVERFRLGTDDTVGFRRLELTKMWSIGTVRKSIDKLTQDVDLLLVTDGMKLLLPIQTNQRNMLEWLRQCKRAAERNHSAVLIGMPQSDLAGIEQDDTSAYDEHHTCYRITALGKEASGTRINVSPGNQNLIVQEV